MDNRSEHVRCMVRVVDLNNVKRQRNKCLDFVAFVCVLSGECAL